MIEILSKIVPLSSGVFVGGKFDESGVGWVSGVGEGLKVGVDVGSKTIGVDVGVGVGVDVGVGVGVGEGEDWIAVME